MTTLYLLDVNVLVALTNPSHTHHHLAHEWFAKVDSWATTALTEAGFVRLMLNPRVTGQQLSTQTVLSTLSQLRAWLGWQFLPDDSSLADPVISTIGLIGHGQVTDFHLVNLAAKNGAVLATFDTAIPAALVGQDKTWVHLI